MATTFETYGNYSFEKISGGVAVYHGAVTNVAHAVRIFVTESEARAWIDGLGR